MFFDSPVTWKGWISEGDFAGLSRGGTHPRKLPASLSMPVLGGVEHREAPERLPDAARTPWELRISCRSAGFRVGQKPCGARPTCHGSPRHRGCKRVRGLAGAKALATARRACAPKGASKFWNHGRGTRAGRAQASFDAAELSDLVFLRVRGWQAPWIEGRSGCRKASRPSRPKGLREQEPQEWQRTQRVRKAGESAIRRGGEKPRGRTVPGEANPGHTDLSADAVEGA
jgi:hypothetical protein